MSVYQGLSSAKQVNTEFEKAESWLLSDRQVMSMFQPSLPYYSQSLMMAKFEPNDGFKQSIIEGLRFEKSVPRYFNPTAKSLHRSAIAEMHNYIEA